jgi:hypothetical protein
MLDSLDAINSRLALIAGYPPDWSIKMPYIEVVEGKCATIAVPAGVYKVRDALNADADFMALSTKADDAGLKLSVTPNVDDQEVTLTLGVDLYEDGHIFQGLTVACAERATCAQQDRTAELFEELTHILTRQGYAAVNRQGLFVTQFD